MLKMLREAFANPWVSYVLISSAASLVIASILLVVASLVMGLLGGFDKKADGNTRNWPYLGFILSLAGIGPLTMFVLSFVLSIAPPPISVHRQAVGPSEKDVAVLGKQILELQKVLQNPGELTLNQVREALTNTLNVSNAVAKGMGVQEKLISELRSRVQDETKKADESRRLAQEVQSLTRLQLEAVKLLITEDVNKASERSFWLGAALSLPVGVFTSLIATWLIRRWGAKGKAALRQAVASTAKH